mmetsp:Transcript_20235/g.64645  ORF Transcript_20235/g.64645 Transcript_20235/m.64645 type:complete len:217 (-) Transcript_20235:175-825(-)
MPMPLLLLLHQAAAALATHATCRRAALRLAALLPASLLLPASAAEEVERLRSADGLIRKLKSHWQDLTIDCRYGEMRRELLSAENKERLLAEASSTSKSGTTVTVCKSSGVQVRKVLGTTAESSLSRMGALLERPALLQRVPEDSLEAYQAASEQLQQALAAADGAAYLAGNDYSAQTTFRRGESTDTPNLDAAFQSVSEAQQALARILEIVQAGG